MLQETDAVQLLIGHQSGLFPWCGREDAMWLEPSLKQVANDLWTLGHKEVLALPVLLHFQRSYQLDLISAEHIIQFLFAKVQ
jgi:hypothetical protein